ncbi:type III secretion system translocon subunit SctE [Chthonobacter rhizosphaerae]|uniref:type III secretion system translocon subunit SctE n=1 Tax=Chthonobacter rhizosphaerae TaxID=2735553 RepID=UPI0015EE8419|nr:type III secretion system translocon subunit SctE [Chthonobacter rhizosphaerae]
MSSISRAPTSPIGGVTTTTDLDRLKSRDTAPSDGIGKGAVGETGPVPPPGEAGKPPTPDQTAAILASLAAFLPRMPEGDQEVALAEVITKLKEMQDANDREGIKAERGQKQAAIDEQRSKLDEAEKKQKQAEDKQKGASIWDKIKLAFQFLLSAISIIVGAIVAPVAPALGALMIIGGVIGIVSGIDTATKMATGLGIAGHAAKAAGHNEDAVAKADMGFGIALAVAGAVVGIATAVVAFKGVADVAAAAAKIGELAYKAINIAQAGATIVTAVGDTAAGAVRYTATKDMADASLSRASAKQSEAEIQMLDDLIDQAIQRLAASGDRFNQMLDALTEAMQDEGQSLTKAKFTA